MTPFDTAGVSVPLLTAHVECTELTRAGVIVVSVEDHIRCPASRPGCGQVDAAVTATVNSRVPTPPTLSFACTVNVEEPIAFGVPARTPRADRDSPFGRVPVATEKVYGVLPPVVAIAAA